MGARTAEPTGAAELNEPVPTAEKLGRYSLCFELASGGMASVYLARAEGPAGFEKLVALKRIHPHLRAKTDFVEMFLDEARIASRVNHPNVCSVFDFGEADGTYFIAMEYILGETFGRFARALARAELLDEERRVGVIARILADACEGLHAAHELRGDDGRTLGVVHRDISPQNLFVAYDGTVRVVDFGIARAEGRIHETQSGTLKGKLSYIAPEQAKKLTLDRRADIWGLGVVAWEMLSGKRLFKRDSEVDTIMAVMTDDIPPPSTVRAGIPKALDDIVLRALERDRDRRYGTAREVGRALNRFIATLPEPATSADVAELMEELFPVQLKKRRALIDQARRGAVGPVKRVSRSLSSEDSGSGASARSHSRSVAIAEALTRTQSATRLKALTAAGVVAAAVIVGIVAASSGGGGDAAAPSPVHTEAAESAAREVTPTAESPGVTSDPSEAAAGATAETAGATTDTEPRGTDTLEAAALADPATPAEAPPGAPPDGPEAVTQRRTRPRAPATPAEPGWVDLATPGGWADVYLGAEHIGRAPGRVRVPAGRHALVLRPFGRDPERRIVVRVPPGGGARAVLDLR